ncbi:hypothetical protein BKI52_20735 [marine bacterium AO1-C]|nr:hypothetical protein BKI52_20735 [marine bacterium AO1-C]
MFFKKTILLSLFTLFGFQWAEAQTEEFKKLISQGRSQQAKGDFEQAITSFRKAITINANSPIANYELANSYYSNKDFEKARAFSQKVIDQKKRYLLAAYLLNGNSLNDLGKLEEANTVFKEAAKKYTHHFLLFYNLGINYYKLKDLEQAIKYTERAVFLKPLHASSHLLLAALHEVKKNQLKAVMAYYFFLMLEPDTPRSLRVLEELKSLLKVLMDNEGGLNPSENPFKMVKYLISRVDLNKGKKKNEMELFVAQTKLLFRMLGNVNKKTPFPYIWNNIYVSLFYRLAKSRHLKACCYFIHQIAPNDITKAWNEQRKNQKATTSFQYWMNKQLSRF